MVKDFFIINTFAGLENNLSNIVTIPVAVFVCPDFFHVQTMQNIAEEINMPETVFVKQLSKNRFSTMCFSPNKKNKEMCCGLFAVAKVINILNDKLNKVDIYINNYKYHARILKDNDVLLEFNIKNKNFNSIKILEQPLLNVLIKNEPILSINRYQNTIIIETKYFSRFGSIAVNEDILSKINYDSIIITSRSNTHDYDYSVKVYSNKNKHNMNIMYNSLLVSNYWHNKIKKINLIGHFSQNDSYIQTFTDSILFNITCKCFMQSNGEISVKNIVK